VVITLNTAWRCGWPGCCRGGAGGRGCRAMGQGGLGGAGSCGSGVRTGSGARGEGGGGGGEGGGDEALFFALLSGGFGAGGRMWGVLFYVHTLACMNSRASSL